MFSSKQTVSNDSMFRCHVFSKTYSMKQYNLHVLWVFFFLWLPFHHSNAHHYTHTRQQKNGAVCNPIITASLFTVGSFYTSRLLQTEHPTAAICSKRCSSGGNVEWKHHASVFGLYLDHGCLSICFCKKQWWYFSMKRVKCRPQVTG